MSSQRTRQTYPSGRVSSQQTRQTYPSGLVSSQQTRQTESAANSPGLPRPQTSLVTSISQTVGTEFLRLRRCCSGACLPARVSCSEAFLPPVTPLRKVYDTYLLCLGQGCCFAGLVPKSGGQVTMSKMTGGPLCVCLFVLMLLGGVFRETEDIHTPLGRPILDRFSRIFEGWVVYTVYLRRRGVFVYSTRRGRAGCCIRKPRAVAEKRYTPPNPRKS